MKRLLLILLLIFISIITFSQGTYDWHEHYNVLHNTKHGYNLDYRIWLLSFLFLASILLMYYSGFFKTKRSSEIKDIKKVKQNNQNHNYQTGYTHLDSTDKLKEIKEQYESEDFWGVIRNIRNKIHELSIAECNELLEFIKVHSYDGTLLL